jgi:DNA-binding response OmpR family regulator
MVESILVVDDEPSIRHAIVRAFADATVREAGTCEEALTLVRDAYPDLVLLDQRLPDGDGLTLLANCRSCCSPAMAV